MRIDKHVVASLSRLGNNTISMSLMSNSFSCMDISSFGCIFHSVLRTEEIMAAFSNSLPSNHGTGKSLPNCTMRVRIEHSPYKGSSLVESLGSLFGSKILMADNTEDLNWLDIAIFDVSYKRLAHSFLKRAYF